MQIPFVFLFTIEKHGVCVCRKLWVTIYMAICILILENKAWKTIVHI